MTDTSKTSGFTRVEREKRLAWLRSENEKAETWGAAISARNEEIREIESILKNFNVRET